MKYVWATDEYTGEEYIVGEILSELTEVRYTPTNGIGVNDVDMMSEEFAYFNDGIYIVKIGEKTMKINSL